MAKGKRRETNEKNHTKQYRETKRSNNAKLIKAVVNSGGQECFTSGDRDELRRSGLLNVKWAGFQLYSKQDQTQQYKKTV